MNEHESISFEIQKELPILSWQNYPSNVFARQVSPEMLTEKGLRAIDTIGSRNSRVPITERSRAVYVFDVSFVVASLRRVFDRLQCSADSFMALCCQACDYTNQSTATALPFNDDSVPFCEYEQSQDELITSLTIIRNLQDYLAEYRAALPAANDKGEYSPRYVKAVLLLEKFENILKYDCGSVKPSISIDEVKSKLARL